MQKNTKSILILLGVGTALYIGYKLISKPATPIVTDNTSGGTTTGGGTNTGGGATTGGGTTTGGALNFVDLAGKLFTAFNGCGTDNTVWRNVLSQLKNQSDWDALNKAYGVRKTTCWADMWNNYEGGLQGAFKNELTDSELAEANAILASKNISSL
jgi:hypothetical protein